MTLSWPNISFLLQFQLNLLSAPDNSSVIQLTIFIIIYSQPTMLSSTLLLLLLTTTVVKMFTPEIKIPLTYAFDYNQKNKLPIELSFNHSYVYSTSPTPELLLLNYTIPVTIRSFLIPPNKSKVEIGLKFPSDFIIALSKNYGVSYQKVQIGLLPFLEVILFDGNLMESIDIWKNGGSFSVDVSYNYGNGIVITNKPMTLTSGSLVYFQEFLIREVLHRMQKQNNINFKFHPNREEIHLIGHLQNLPHLTLAYNGSIFKLELKGPILYYIPALKNKERMTYVGYKAIKGNNKLSFLKNGDIQFKSTWTVYQLYLYLVYFVALFTFLIFYLKKNIYDTSLFVKHIFKWMLLKDNNSRVEVLRSELE